MIRINKIIVSGIKYVTPYNLCTVRNEDSTPGMEIPIAKAKTIILYFSGYLSEKEVDRILFILKELLIKMIIFSDF